MLQDFLTDFNNAKLQSSLIPKGTIVKVKMAIKPGGYENWFTKSYDTGSIYLNAEFTVIEGPYAKCKIYQIIGIKSGKSEGKEDTWGESGRSMIRSILESARNIHTNDTSEKAVLARKINSIADLNGLEFTAKVGIEANNTYGDRNRIATVITPEQEKNSDADWIPFQINCNYFYSKLIGGYMEFCITESRQEIKMLLAHNIKECLSYLLPGGKFGYGFYSGNINKDHLMVVAEGKQTGTWYNCDKKTNGDIIELWSIITNKTDFSEITSLITKWLSERIIAKYSYLDKNNEAIAYVYLYKNNYRHIWNLRTSRNGLKPLYNIPGIIKSDEVIIVKGENRADSLIKRGFTATTAIDDDIEKTDWSMLTDKHIIIWPEKDEQYVKKVAVELDNLGMSCENPESLGISSENRESLSVLSEKKAFPASHYLNDKSPSPEDIILPRILTPGGLLLLGGAPKVGKTDLLLSWLAHLSAGLPFLSMVPIRPLKIFYLQTDLEYPYIKERLQQLKFDDKSLELISKNLIITPKTSLLLNSQGVEEVKDIIAERLDVKTVDIIAIDTLRGVFDFNQYKGENSNSSMFCFLKDRVEKLRSITNPSCGIILTHNTNKVSKKSLVEEPFQNFSGASALRSFYTSGIMMIKPNGEQNTRQLIFELRNGKSILPMQIEKVNDSWQTVSEKPTVKQRRKKSYDIILRLINERAAKGKFYTKSQFCYLFEDTFGLKSCHSIRRYVNALVASGYIKFYEKEIPERVKVMKVAEHLTRRDI